MCERAWFHPTGFFFPYFFAAADELRHGGAAERCVTYCRRPNQMPEIFIPAERAIARSAALSGGGATRSKCLCLYSAIVRCFLYFCVCVCERAWFHPAEPLTLANNHGPSHCMYHKRTAGLAHASPHPRTLAVMHTRHTHTRQLSRSRQKSNNHQWSSGR